MTDYGVNEYKIVRYRDFADLRDLTYVVQASGGPIDEREFKDHVHPDTDASYDIGHDGKAVRHIVATSGTFDEAVINGVAHSAVPPIVYAVQASGGPVDTREVKAHIIPDTTASYDLGTASLLFRRVDATSGVFTNLACVAGININDHMHPNIDSTQDLGTPDQRFREVYGVSGVFDSKSFIIPHPTMPDKSIKYTCPEGPEFGVYCRGVGKLHEGTANIIYGGEFEHVARPESITIQLTPMGKAALLYYSDVSEKGFKVNSDKKEVIFSWRAEGTRKDKPAVHDTIISESKVI